MPSRMKAPRKGKKEEPRTLPSKQRRPPLLLTLERKKIKPSPRPWAPARKKKRTAVDYSAREMARGRGLFLTSGKKERVLFARTRNLRGGVRPSFELAQKERNTSQSTGGGREKKGEGNLRSVEFTKKKEGEALLQTKKRADTISIPSV